MRLPKFSDHQALELYRKGMNDVDAAKKLGVTKGAVCAWRHKRGLPANKTPTRCPSELRKPSTPPKPRRFLTARDVRMNQVISVEMDWVDLGDYRSKGTFVTRHKATGIVTYIHPKRRFFTITFYVGGGASFRQSFKEVELP